MTFQPSGPVCRLLWMRAFSSVLALYLCNLLCLSYAWKVIQWTVCTLVHFFNFNLKCINLAWINNQSDLTDITSEVCFLNCRLDSDTWSVFHHKETLGFKKYLKIQATSTEVYSLWGWWTTINQKNPDCVSQHVTKLCKENICESNVAKLNVAQCRNMHAVGS